MSKIKLLLDVYNAGRAMRMTAVVDDDFPEMMHNFDSAIRAVEKSGPVDRIFIDVEEELTRARTKWPDNVHMLAALTEEVGELAQAILHVNYEPEKHTSQDVYKEAVQSAVMAIRVATEGDSTLPLYDPSAVWRK